jgi:hypothetical protein
MPVQIKLLAVGKTRWYEYAIRFVLGGAVTVVAGLIAATWGPVVGGLFLAFPAIFPASATLIEKHEREKKTKLGLQGARRGREAAALEAAGATLGSLGLAAFATVFWLVAPAAPGLALVAATVTWTVVSVVLWIARRHMRIVAVH